MIASLLLAVVYGLVTWSLLNNRPVASRATFGLQGYCFAVMSALIAWRHRDNFRRLLRGTEPPIWRSPR